MTIIVFLVDNSASMAQKAYVGVSYLDFARQFVEAFLKLRQRDATFKSDRYMLMSFDDYPRNVKAGWKESQSQFNEQLRNLRPVGRGQFAEALFNAIRFVNLNRVQSGIENYGFGRYPSYSEPVVFISLLDATSDSARKNFLQNNKFPKLPAFGAELTEEPYRWDYKLFVVYVNLPGHSLQRVVQPIPFSSERKQADLIVEKMNGRTFELSSHRQVNGVIESILQRVQQIGVLVKFDRFGPMPNTPGVLNGDVAARSMDNWKSQVVQITRIPKGPQNTQSAWPIPESFWPDPTMQTLPSRKVFPELVFRCEPTEQISMTNIAIDKYELEPCPLTQVLIDKKMPNECWQVFVINSHKSPGIGYPFGYLKLSNNLQTVNLFVFPYNYPLLFAIIEEVKDQRMNKTPEFRAKVDKYFANIPPYYNSPLRKALSKIPIPHPALDDRIQSPASYNGLLVTQFKKWRDQGREELESTCQQISNFINPTHHDATKVFNVICGVHQLPMVDVNRHFPATNSEQPTKIGILRNYQPLQPLFKDCKIAVSTTRYLKNPSSKFRNPYDIDREEIVDHLEKMRVNLDLQILNSSIAVLEGGLPGQRIKLQHAEDLHTLPVVKMGDYQEYSKRLIEIGRGPMREFEQQVAKPHAFGNPFKLDKKTMAVDEVGELPVANTNVNNGLTLSAQSGILKNAAKLTQWKRRFSTPTSSRGNTPEPELKRPRLELIVEERFFNSEVSSSSVDTFDLPTIGELTSSVINNTDVTKSAIKQVAVDHQTVDSRRTPDKTKNNGLSRTERLSIARSNQPEVNASNAEGFEDDDIQIVLDTSVSKKQSEIPKVRQRVCEPSSTFSSSSSSVSDDDSKTNGQSTSVFGDSEFPMNVDFKRRPYPASALPEVDDPPTLSSQEMTRHKFKLIRAIRHKDNSTCYDPVKECIRLVNELSWREQFNCLDYAHEQAKKFGLAKVAVELGLELKRVVKCIQITKSDYATNQNGTAIV